jgi:hypothetical protein
MSKITVAIIFVPAAVRMFAFARPAPTAFQNKVRGVLCGAIMC